MLITDLNRTSRASPSQWEFRTDNNRPAYVRYRYGTLTVSVGPPDGDMDSAICGTMIFSDVMYEPSYTNKANELQWEEVANRINDLDVEQTIADDKANRVVYEDRWIWPSAGGAIKPGKGESDG